MSCLILILAGLHCTEQGDITDDITTPTHHKQPPDGDAQTSLRYSGASFDYGAYQPLEKIYGWVGNMVHSNREIAVPFFVTNSYENRTLTGLKISTLSTIRRPILWVQAGTHGRDWLTTASLIYVIKELLGNNSDVAIRKATDAFDWFFLPVLNPDGYHFSWTQNRAWSKTRSRQGQCKGVDLGRNWDFHWCEADKSRGPCDDTYCGPTAFSEVEVKGVSSYIQGLDDVRGFISLEGYGQRWMTPWGYTDNRTKDFHLQNGAAGAAVSALQGVRGSKYQHGELSRLAGQCDIVGIGSVLRWRELDSHRHYGGGSSDWTYGHLGITYSYHVQLGNPKYRYLVPAKEIEPTGRELLQALLALADYITAH